MALVSQRLRTHVRLWLGDQDKPMGSGFVLDDRHIMTCAHVVGDCLKQRVELRDQETAPRDAVTFDMPMAPQTPIRAVVVPGMWHPERTRSRAADMALIDDVAVLRIVDGDVLPPGAGPVIAAPRIGERDTTFAYGTDADLRDTNYVDGRIIEQVSMRRLKLVAEPPGVRPGCSGAAAWNVDRGGISGMIAERSADASGLVIPIDTLAEVWPGFADANHASPARSFTRRAPRRLLRDELAQRLCQFDRKPQASEFETFAIEDFDAGRRPMLCAIAGMARDEPRLCRDKIKQANLQRRLDDLGIPARLVDARRLPWPEDRRFDAAVAFTRLRNMLGDELGSRGTAAEMRREYGRVGRPLLLFSQIDQAAWGDAQRMLLSRWGALWEELRDAPWSLPLVHFLLVRLDDRRFDARHSNPYAKFSRFSRDVADATGGVARALSPLQHIDVDEVEGWLHGLSDEVTAGAADIERARQDVRRELGRISFPRLADLNAWVERLRI